MVQQVIEELVAIQTEFEQLEQKDKDARREKQLKMEQEREARLGLALQFYMETI